MKRQPRILAGTAIGLLMASAPLGAYPLLKAGADEPRIAPMQSTAVPFTLAQADCLEGETAEDCAARLGTPPEATTPETNNEETETPPADEPAATTESETPETTTEETESPAADEPATTTEGETTEQPETTTEETVVPPAGETETTTEGQGGATTTDQSAQPVEDPNAAPILDSAKEELLPAPQEGGAETGEAVVPPPVVDPGPPPETDAAAQADAQPAEVQAVKAEEGKRRNEAPKQEERERPDGAEILQQIAGQIVIQINNQIVVENDDRPRIGRGATEVYYEDLPRGRTRETVVRPNGNQIITIRNRHGDILQRSRITPDGREYVLNYVDDQYYENIEEWRDPGLDLPPMRLNIPRNQYILEAEYAENPDQYYEFLDQPPVEKVQRLYSVDEVKRSARVRDIARRVDLDTLTFEFGSASIPEAEVGKLKSLATAMTRMLEQNPAETFLIEGHTDAVGSDVANLALSDRRAEAVANALTDYFEIPPENLSTQGYGERYLKVKSEEPERENRRVAVRRITALVAPVASAN